MEKQQHYNKRQDANTAVRSIFSVHIKSQTLMTTDRWMIARSGPPALMTSSEHPASPETGRLHLRPFGIQVEPKSGGEHQRGFWFPKRILGKNIVIPFHMAFKEIFMWETYVRNDPDSWSHHIPTPSPSLARDIIVFEEKKKGFQYSGA